MFNNALAEGTKKVTLHAFVGSIGKSLDVSGSVCTWTVLMIKSAMTMPRLMEVPRMLTYGAVSFM
jgi:hypothetical protein